MARGGSDVSQFVVAQYCGLMRSKAINTNIIFSTDDSGCVGGHFCDMSCTPRIGIVMLRLPRLSTLKS